MANIQNQLEIWFDQEQPIPGEEIYRFLHAVKGTAGTIGLTALYEAVTQLMNQLEEQESRDWSPQELRSFLMSMVTITYEYHANQDLILPAGLSRGTEESKQPLLLVVDNDVQMLMTLKEELEKKGCLVIGTVNPDKAVSLYHDWKPDCLILDLPQREARRVMNELNEQIRKQLVWVIMTGCDEERERRLDAFRLGADDYYVKPLDLEELLIKLEIKLERKKWFDNALFLDELTGAYNRKFMKTQFEKLCSGPGLALAVLDLDNFKQVNDRYGHMVGDQTLHAFSEFIKCRLRREDSIIRFGGEEFVLLLPETRGEEAVGIVDRLRDEFASHSFETSAGELTVSFSAGVVEHRGSKEPLKYWLGLADQALYRAKSLGKNRVELAIPGSDKPVNAGWRVAIIDDDAIIRTMMAEYVSHFFPESVQAEIRTFGNGEIFLADDWHRQEGTYLLLLDGIMPRMDGLEVLQRVRAYSDSDKYNIIMLTGRKSEKDIVKALQLGADDYVTKPFGIQELEARVKRLIQRKK